MEATLPSKIEFTDILLTTALPLHPSLAANPCLFVALSEGEEICAETPAVDGDLAAGIWQINSRLSVESVKQSVTLAVVSSKTRIRVASVTLSLAELLTRIKAQSDGYHEFVIGDSDSSVQLVLTCSVNASPSLIVNPPSHVGTHDNHTDDDRSIQSSQEPDLSELPSREYLESMYAIFTHVSDHDERKAHGLSLVGRAYYDHHRETRAKADLERAIIIHEEAMQLTGPFHPQMAQHTHHFSLPLIERFQQSGDIVDIERAISYIQTALDHTEDLDADKPNLLNNLGSAFQLRFKHLGNLADLEDAILNKQKAVNLTSDGHPDKPSRLNNLGNALQSRFNRLGGLADLEDAIVNNQKAVELTPEGRPDKPSLLSNLGNALETRFNRLGGLTDLEDAIVNNQKAVELTPDGHPGKPRLLSNLGVVLQSRFDRLGGLADLEDAIVNNQKAVELTPDGHPNKPSRLKNLGNAFQSRFDRLGGLTDLEDAIVNNQKAVELTPDGHPNKPSLLNNLGIAFQSHFDRLGGLADLEDAIVNKQKAVELTPDGHPDKPGLLSNLGCAFISRFRCLSILSDLEGGLSVLSTAANSTTGSAMTRFKVARFCAEVAEEYSRSPLEPFSCAINLLPRIAWLGLAVTDQHALLADVGTIVRDAVAAAIRYEEYETAVVWAEQGRSIVWQNLLGLRSPVDKLRETYPELANRLRRVAVQLEGSESQELIGDKAQAAAVEDVSHKYPKLALEWDNLVEEIRSLPTFEGFLKAKTFSQRYYYYPC